MNSFLLDLNGILFAVQLVLLLTLGPYADYGRWRPYLLICMQAVLQTPSRPVGVVLTLILVFEAMIYICCFCLASFDDYSQWKSVFGFWFLGNLCLNIANTFYYAGFPTVVRNFPELRRSEREVFNGTKSPEEHSQFDSLSRAKVSATSSSELYSFLNGSSSTTTALVSPRQ